MLHKVAKLHPALREIIHHFFLDSPNNFEHLFNSCFPPPSHTEYLKPLELLYPCKIVQNHLPALPPEHNVAKQ